MQDPQFYPVRFSVDYPERELDNLSTLLRLFFAIPILVVLGAVAGPGSGWDHEHGARVAAGSGGVLVLGPLLMLLFRQKYPRWWFDWNLELLRFANRVVAYLALMDDRYPSTDDPQSVYLDIDYPDAKRDLNRWLPLVKWLLAFPHYVALLFLSIGAVLAVIVAWFAILFTGQYPRSLFSYVEGVIRWHNRVMGYAFILVTDRYPPFNLD
jgi:Domain of unknown function (DUF4389)